MTLQKLEDIITDLATSLGHGVLSKGIVHFNLPTEELNNLSDEMVGRSNLIIANKNGREVTGINSWMYLGIHIQLIETSGTSSINVVFPNDVYETIKRDV